MGGSPSPRPRPRPWESVAPGIRGATVPVLGVPLVGRGRGHWGNNRPYPPILRGRPAIAILSLRAAISLTPLAGASIHFVRQRGHFFSSLGLLVSIADRQLRPMMWRHPSILMRTGVSSSYVSKQMGHSSCAGSSSGRTSSVWSLMNASQRSRAALWSAMATLRAPRSVGVGLMSLEWSGEGASYIGCVGDAR